MPVVRILIGMIASGKSTHAKHLAKQGWIVVNDDAIVTAIHGGDYTLYNKRLKPLYKAVETHLVLTALAMGLSVVVDRGVNTSRSARRRFIGLATSVDADCEAVIFPTTSPEEHARRRTESDPRGNTYTQWLKASRRHFLDWEDPSLEEGFTRIIPCPTS